MSRHVDHCTGPGCWVCQARAGAPSSTDRDVCPWHPDSPETTDRSQP